MSWSRIPRWAFVLGGLLTLTLAYIGFMNWRYDYAECDRLMRAFEDNTRNEIVVDRLDAECPAWEANA
jgi:hypothetical protein